MLSNLWLTRMGSNVGIQVRGIKVDNTGALQLASNDLRHGRTKHIDVRYHHIRECVASGKVELSQVTTSVNVAHVLAKALPREAFVLHCAGMGLCAAIKL